MLYSLEERHQRFGDIVSVFFGRMKVVLADAMQACGKSNCMPHLTPNLGKMEQSVNCTHQPLCLHER